MRSRLARGYEPRSPGPDNLHPAIIHDCTGLSGSALGALEREGYEGAGKVKIAFHKGQWIQEPCNLRQGHHWSIVLTSVSSASGLLPGEDDSV